MNKLNHFLAFAFLFILLFPLIGSVVNFDKNIYLNDNRPLLELPHFSFSKNFSADFNNYYNDHFGLRKLLVIGSRWLKLKLFHTSPSKSVSWGKNDWFFYTPDVNYIDTINAQPFSSADLDQIKNNLQSLQDKFASQKIKFYFLVVPNKQSVYPEYLPDYVKKLRPDSRLDQLTAYLSQFPQINFINPQPELIAAKSLPVYLKNDSHWNDQGAFIAYQTLLNKLKIKPYLKTDYLISPKPAINQDLVEVQMGIRGLNPETEVAFSPKNPQSKLIVGNCPDVYKTCPKFIKEIDNPRLPTLLMFRDSFGNKLIPFLSEHFRRSYYHWGAIPHPLSLVAQEKPDIVIMELTERELWRLKDPLLN